MSEDGAYDCIQTVESLMGNVKVTAREGQSAGKQEIYVQ